MHTREMYNIDTPLKDYTEGKLDMLQREFKLKLTAYDIARMRRCRTEMQVDNYAHALIMQKL